MMLEKKGAVEGYTKKGRVWVEVQWGTKNRKRESAAWSSS